MSTKLVRKLKLTRTVLSSGIFDTAKWDTDKFGKGEPLSKLGRFTALSTAPGIFDVGKWDTAKFGGAGIGGTRIEILDP